ncbi:MAG: DUF1934 domain-containing protein [Eubacteriales bacterium]|nr:DUF1934 domain-containing protein [Eubacteriales bacterium]
MQPNVMITIEGHQWGLEEPEQTIRLTTEGQLYQENEIWHVAYDESEATGMAGTHTVLTVDPFGAVTLARSGSHDMELVFVQGSRHITRMATPYGDLDVGIYTNVVQSDLKASGGSIHLGYSVDFNQQETTNTRLDMQIRLKG